MITGDNVRTAASIARQCGIIPRDCDVEGVVAEGESLAELMATATRRTAGDMDPDLDLDLDLDLLPEYLVLEAARFKRLVGLGEGQRIDMPAFRCLV